MTNIRELLIKSKYEQVKDVLERAGRIGKSKGIAVYAVGGLVRDLLMDKALNDIDIVIVGEAIPFAKLLAGELDVKNAEAEMGKVVADMRAGRVRLSKCTIRAPFSGRIVEIKMGRHQFAKVGVEILKIIDDINLEIVFMVPSKWVSWLKPGYEFLYLVDETSKKYKARVVQRGAQIDSVSRSILLIGTTIGRHPELIPGMSGIIKFKPSAGL